MTYVYRYFFPALWITWALYWMAISRDVKATARIERPASRLLHTVPLIIAVYLLWVRSVPIAILNERFLPSSDWPFWIGAALAAGGILFTVWARRHLGRNWSGNVTIKVDHQLVTSGPYALVRHPIYTGLLLAFFGSAIACGEWRGVLAFVLAAASLWRKLRIEERWMREQFGESYRIYSQRVAALVPFVF